MVIEEVAVLNVLVRRHRRAVGAAVRRAVDDEVPGAVEEEAGPLLEGMDGHHRLRYRENEKYYTANSRKHRDKWPLNLLIQRPPRFLSLSLLSHGTRPLIIQITVPLDYHDSRLLCLSD